MNLPSLRIMNWIKLFFWWITQSVAFSCKTRKELAEYRPFTWHRRRWLQITSHAPEGLFLEKGGAKKPIQSLLSLGNRDAFWECLVGWFGHYAEIISVILRTKAVKMSGGSKIVWDQCHTCGSSVASRALQRLKRSARKSRYQNKDRREDGVRWDWEERIAILWWDLGEGAWETETQSVQLRLKREGGTLSLARLGGTTKPTAVNLT